MAAESAPAGRGWQVYLETAVENANDAVIVCEYDAAHPSKFRMQYVNPMFERQTGYTREEAIGAPPDLLYGPHTDRAVVERTRQALIDGLPMRVELQKYRKDGTSFWSEVNMRPLAGERGGPPLGYVAIQRDIDDRMEAVARMELLSSAIDQANDAMAIFEWKLDAAQWRLAYVNEMFLRITGYRRDDVIGRSSDFLVGPQTDMEELHRYRVALLGGDPVRGEIAFYRADGTPFWAEINGRALSNRKGQVINTIIVYRDVTEKHFRDERLTFEAAHDPLTGVFNRRSFMQSLESAVRETAMGLAHGLLFFDLDGFKPVNDRFGHEAGDRLLVELTAAVASRLRRGDIFARVGGDEFAILLAGCSKEQCEQIAELVLATIANFVLLWEGHRLAVGASIGVTAIDGSMHDGADAMRAADEACYEAKREGRNRVVVARG